MGCCHISLAGKNWSQGVSGCHHCAYPQEGEFEVLRQLVRHSAAGSSRKSGSQNCSGKTAEAG